MVKPITPTEAAGNVPGDDIDAEVGRINAEFINKNLMHGTEWVLGSEEIVVTVQDHGLSYSQMEQVCQRFIDEAGWTSVEASPAPRGSRTLYSFIL